MISRVVRSSIGWLFLVPLSACSDDSSAGSSQSVAGDDELEATEAPSSSQFCGEICGAASSCDGQIDAQTCEATCFNGSAAALPKLSSALTEQVLACAARVDCRTVLDGRFLGMCFDEAIAASAPASSGVEFCDTYVAASQRCGHASDRAACLGVAKVFNDETLRNATACADKHCDQIDACVAATLTLPAETDGSSLRPVSIAGFSAIASRGSSPSGLVETVCRSDDACAACVLGACCAESLACAESTSCIALGSCLSDCQSDACRDACVAQEDAGVEPYARLVSCYAEAGEGSCYEVCAEDEAVADDDLPEGEAVADDDLPEDEAVADDDLPEGEAVADDDLPEDEAVADDDDEEEDAVSTTEPAASADDGEDEASAVPTP